MFGFFKKKQATPEQIEAFREFARESMISSKPKDGQYSAIMIFPPEPAVFFEKAKKHIDAFAAFVHGIEDRISKDDFRGVLTSSSVEDDLGKSSAKRYVIAAGKDRESTKILFDWPGPGTLNKKKKSTNKSTTPATGVSK